MRDRWPLVMVAAVVAIIAFGVYAVMTSPAPGGAAEPANRSRTEAGATPSAAAPSPTPTPSPTPPPPDTPEATADRYFSAWQGGDLATMVALVADAPSDFTERHRRFDADLRISSLFLAPGPPRREGEDAAEVPFEGVREVTGLGRWPFSSTLRLARRDGTWAVLWTPETMHPSLKDGARLRLKETQVRRAGTLTREGEPFPADSKARDYFSSVSTTHPRLVLEESPSGRVLLSTPEPPASGTRTTISRRAQAAADRALEGVQRPAALVALDIASGEVRAVADTLGGKQAFRGLYPPGSAFKVVTAAALLRGGLTPQTPVGCPASYTIPGARSFTNDGGADHGTVTLSRAFALSCNTTFVRQAYERLRDGRLSAEAAERFGFREKPGLSFCRIRPPSDLNELGADAIGQNSAQASPLCMAEVAAAVASGVWKPAVMTDASDAPPRVPLDEGVASGLRAMMGAVVSDGTAARAGLPSGTAGKTGTAEVAGAAAHAWFIGYRGSLAFAVFVQNGGSGGTVAAPIAARFLR
ncbi:penicillin-binding transpeptidase domain-containing protein [Sphaerisporangium sp. TRM90804]|uniref:penicillin-binding transpeptidase domain-containing protein n=1 Tax=Sphaerisporangium sp. TRM90804 TaxID=3031113 RepID=UPI00244C78E7|nr:penicillin-binding transpeptidase domain-containing protein [Sphaerisporangium sp. TRM90804]MDH2427849.1 penicillin-binding transpeptidase domain-containing protein [Sphaerisporangium sp. TRM90804]